LIVVGVRLCDADADADDDDADAEVGPATADDPEMDDPDEPADADDVGVVAPPAPPPLLHELIKQVTASTASTPAPTCFRFAFHIAMLLASPDRVGWVLTRSRRRRRQLRIARPR
jgi:hypothetical protein